VTQVVLRRSVLLDGAWRPLVDRVTEIGFDNALRAGLEDAYLIASPRGRYFAEEMATMGRLRGAGLLVE
jgi:hypothetical protein